MHVPVAASHSSIVQAKLSLHSAALTAGSLGVNSHPRTESQLKTWHRFGVGLAVGVASHAPDVPLHWYVVHAVLFGQTIAPGRFTQVLLTHVSVVHKLVSAQSNRIASALFGVTPQPVVGLQVLSSHNFAKLQLAPMFSSSHLLAAALQV